MTDADQTDRSEGLVQAAGPVALQVETSRADSADCLRVRCTMRAVDLGIERARHRRAPISRRASVVVMPDAAYAEAETRGALLGLLDQSPASLAVTSRVMRNARRQAGRRRLVPGRQARSRRDSSRISSFVEVDFVERAADRRTRARPGGRAGSRRDRRRCCRRRSRRCHARRRLRQVRRRARCLQW